MAEPVTAAGIAQGAPFEPTRTMQAVSLPGLSATASELVAEVPVAMVFDGSSAAVMMASPCDIEDFAVGFALTEGFITGLGDVLDLAVVEHEAGIEARFWLQEGRAKAVAERRRSMAGPVGCGLCGLESIGQAVRPLPRLADKGSRVAYDDLNTATEALRSFQPLHDRARAVHGAGFVLPGRGIVRAREDVGRHNALDKLIGALVRDAVDPADGAIVLTSRVSVELVQKAAIAGCPIIIAVSAPTAFAVETADSAGITLAAFARGDGFRVFSHPRRLGVRR